MSNEKKFSFYFFSDGEMLEEVDADSDAEAFAELTKYGYRLKGFFTHYTRYTRATGQMELFEV